jgi:N-methylhydantoinase A
MTDRRFKVGIDVGGTFTDFFLVEGEAEPVIHKILSTPGDPSVAVLDGLQELAGIVQPPMPSPEFLRSITVVVHGTTVTTNATLTRRGAKTGLLTTAGLRDALEMRRGVREERYDNRFTNVAPVAPRSLRFGIGGRLDRHGNELAPLAVEEVRDAVRIFAREGVEAVAICFMNAFAEPSHERQAAAIVAAELPTAFLSVSTEVLPCIRFYDRLSTTALNAYVGPILNRYLASLQDGLAEAGFGGVLLVMQSNGGVMSPDVGRRFPALTLLSGPAGGPGAGLFFTAKHGLDRGIVVDMGGTSFEASLVVGSPVVNNEGEIDRLRCALPMLSIHTIGAGGGSIGWIDAGGILRMGPQSAGAKPGPACYSQGGVLPTTTDANLVLGYLDPDFFAGGRLTLDPKAAWRAIEIEIAKPLGMTVEQAAVGMCRVACNNMAQGVREVTIQKGSDPREFPLVVAGGAGPLHSCMIASEIDIELQIIPRESSVLCAAGMLMGDLKHDQVRTFVDRMPDPDWTKLGQLIEEMRQDGARLLRGEGVPDALQQHEVKFDCRYLKQYHEVSFIVPRSAIDASDSSEILQRFHAEHTALYGYSLKADGSPVEIINLRVQSRGATDKPKFRGQTFAGPDPAAALKGRRRAYVSDEENFRDIPCFDGSRLRYGNRIAGPALIESPTTTILVEANWEAAADRYGSLVLFRKGRESLVADCIEGKML